MGAYARLFFDADWLTIAVGPATFAWTAIRVDAIVQMRRGTWAAPAVDTRPCWSAGHRTILPGVRVISGSPPEARLLPAWTLLERYSIGRGAFIASASRI